MTVGWFDIDDGIRPFPFLLQTELTQNACGNVQSIGEEGLE